MVLFAQARETQQDTISRWLLNNYGDGKRVAQWNDHYFSLCSFSAGQFAKQHGLTYDQARRRLNAMAAEGDIERIKFKYGPVSYRFSRPICDDLAGRAIRAHLDAGWSQDEKRSAPRANTAA